MLVNGWGPDSFTSVRTDVAPTVTIRPAGSNPPVAPEGDISDLCPAADGTIVEVRGYPSSPFRWKPFTQTYVAPPRAQVAASYARWVLWHGVTGHNVGKCSTPRALPNFNDCATSPRFKLF